MTAYDLGPKIHTSSGLKISLGKFATILTKVERVTCLAVAGPPGEGVSRDYLYYSHPGGSYGTQSLSQMYPILIYTVIYL